MGFFPARSEGSPHEMHLVTTSEGIEIVVDAYAAQETVVARGVSYTLPSRHRAVLWVNHGLDIDAVLPIVRRLLGFEWDTPTRLAFCTGTYALTEPRPVYTPASDTTSRCRRASAIG